MELNEREKNIVDLINKLSVAASDETTTQEVIDKIIGGIRETTSENIRKEMEDSEKEEVTKVEFPGNSVASEIDDAIKSERDRVMGGIYDDIRMGPNVHATQLIFTRIREVKSPTKAHPTDAGIDFFVPDEKAWDEDFRKKVIEYSRANSNKEYERGAVWFSGGNRLWVEPGAHVAIPSGIKTIIPPGLGMMFVNKSGVATKLKLDHSACLVDSEYRDEIIMCFFNHNTKSVEIEPGMKITQGLIVPIIQVRMQEVLNCVYDDIGKASDRGGGFGSSGEK